MGTIASGSRGGFTRIKGTQAGAIVAIAWNLAAERFFSSIHLKA